MSACPSSFPTIAISFITRRAGSCGVSATGITVLYDPPLYLTYFWAYPAPEPMEFSFPCAYVMHERKHSIT
jgi:hypothetical protein